MLSTVGRAPLKETSKLENRPADNRESQPGRTLSTPGSATAKRRPGIFYGWWIVGASTLSGTIQSLFFTVGSAALFLPIAREFQTTRTVVSGAFAFSRLEGGLTGPIEGYLVHWVGPRRYIMVGWIIFGLGLVGIGLSQSLLQFYAAFLVATLGQSVAGFLPIVTVLVNWFLRYRGRAIAVYQLGTSFGAMLLPLFAWSVLNIGWRETMVAAGIIAIAIGVPLSTMMRARPEDYGYLPDGAQPEPPQEDAIDQQVGRAEGRPDSSEPDSTIRQALRSRNFWLLGGAHMLSLWAWGALRVHLIPSLVDIRIAEQTAANMFAISLTIAGAGRLLGGFLGDLWGARRVLVISYLLQGISMVILAFATNLFHVSLFAVTFGLAWGARGTVMTVLRGEVFGRTNFSRLSGFMDPLTMGGVVISPIFAGLTFDTLGSYRYAFLSIAVLGTMGSFLLMGLRLPKPRSAKS